MGLLCHAHCDVECIGPAHRISILTWVHGIVWECHFECINRFPLPHWYHRCVPHINHWWKWRDCYRLEDYSDKVLKGQFHDWFLIDSALGLDGRHILRRKDSLVIQTFRLPQVNQSYPSQSYHQRYECLVTHKGGPQALQTDLFLASLRSYIELSVVCHR